MKRLIFQINDGNQNAALAERSNIFSGAITPNSPASSGSKDHGVIFTFNKKFGTTVIEPEGNTPIAISEISPEILLETIIENTDLPASETDRFFHITGGYFIDIQGPRSNRVVTTSQVFGVALEPRFGITEGGKTILVDNWKLLDDRRSLDDMDERKKGPKTEMGWTLIVEEAKTPRSKYPLSGEPIRMIQECADIVNIAHENIAETDTSITYRFTATVDGPEPKEFIWNLGDGSNSVNNGKTIEHTYQKSSAASTLNISLQTVGVGKCGSNAGVEIPIPPITVKPCPVVTQVDALQADLTDSNLKYNFSVQMSGGVATNFDWDFGDGNTKRTKNPKATHTYARPSDGDKKFQVRVNTSGPDNCTGSGETEVPVPVQCPKLGQINENLKVLSGDKAKYEFEVVFTGVKPTTFHWDFGDGTSADIPRAKVEHTYDRPLDAKKKLIVTVNSEGPTDECEGSSRVEIEILPQCPAISPSLRIVNPEPDPNSNSHTITFTTEFTGPRPNTFEWNFGDGSPIVSTETPTASHTFEKPGNLRQGRFQVSVTAKGPEDCEGVARGEVEIPQPCPEITSLLGQISALSDREAHVDFRVQVDGNLPTAYTWDFGDGNTKKTTIPEVSHIYARSKEADQTFIVKVLTQGPQDCTGNAQTDVLILAQCPQITSISASGVLTDLNQPEITFRFETHFDGIQPELFSWDFGDGTVEQTTSPVVEHTYPRPRLQNAQNLIVQVRTTGPENCQGSAQVEISIDPSCPEIGTLDSQIAAISDREAHVDFRVKVNGNLPTEYTWDFGDGNTQKTTIPEASHTYIRSTDGDKTFIVKVLTKGPQDCTGNAQTDVLIPVQCPQITHISAVSEPVIGNSQTIAFTAQVVGKMPNVFHWDFGDGNTANSNSPSIKHRYELPEEAEEEFEVNLTTEGPSTCTGEATTKVKVKPSCPVILEIRHLAATPIGDTQSYKFTPIIKGPKPDVFEWDFGDGTTAASQGSVEHVFTRPQGADTSIEITLTISGPDNCSDQKKIRVPLEGICPVILDIQKEPIELTETQFIVEFTANIQGATPDTFVWNFGDGTGSQTTPDNKITHTYERPDGNSQSFTVSLNISGPGQTCRDTKEVSCHVPGECPVVVDILKIKERLTETSLELELKAIISPEGTHPDLFKWNFGDGSPVVETTVPTISHTYQRTEVDIQAVIFLETEGPVPGNDVPACASSIQIACPIPGIPCPVLVGILSEKGIATPVLQPYTFTADIRGTLEPSLYTWDFGDGSPIQETTSKTVKHNYSRPAGDQQEFTVKLDTKGSADHCQTSVNTSVEVGGVCPQIMEVSIQEELSDDKLTVTLTPTIEGPAPDGYQVDWGDGKFRPQVLEQPPFVNVYDRKPGKAHSYKIKINASGPGNCHSEWKGQIEVPPLCPSIVKVEQTVTEVTEFMYGVRFEVFWEGPRPELFILYFGIMTNPIVSKEPVIFQNFKRTSGQNLLMKGKLTLQGPETCKAEVDLVVDVPQSCPTFKTLTQELLSSTKDGQTFKFKVKTEGFPPEKYQWDFGDGKGIQENRSANFTYTYKRPIGNPETYVVKVTGVGPKDCRTEVETEVDIAPRCPELTAITAKVQPPTEISLEVAFTALVGEPTPDTFNWAFGDGSPVVQTTVPTVNHIFQRPIGAEVVYTIKVQAEGPADCSSEAELPCPIPGRCPEIKGIQIQMDPPLPKQQKVHVSASIADIMPDQFIWNFGDGSGNKVTQTPHTEHTYQRPIGEQEKYTISVQGNGPDDCGSSADEVVIIEAICPEITGIATKVKPPTETQLEVVFTALVSDPKPLEYIWDFGDNSGIKKTSSPTIAHVYTRPAGDAETLTVTVTGKGPKSCESSVEITCPIPGICPVISEMELVSQVQPKIFSVVLTPTISGPSPDGYRVDWGDGTPQTQGLTSPPFKHTYDRPEGNALKQTIKVQALGPDSCEGDWEGEIEVPGVCPQITNIKQEVVEETDFAYKIKFTVFFEGPTPEMIILGFGTITTPIILMGSDVINGAEIIQEFIRFGGIDQDLKGQISVQGPQGCKDEQEIEVFIPGSCPRITNLQKEIQETTRELQTLNFTAIELGVFPEKHLWDFGDGTPPIESHGRTKTYVHAYKRLAGEDKTYIVTLTAIGPKDCRTEQKIEVEIPGVCPAINTFKKVNETLTEAYKRVSYELSFVDILPSSYEWDWGDGSGKEITQAPRASHDYPILPGDTKQYTVQVSAIGPGSCISADTDPVEVPGVCPRILSVSPVLGIKEGDRQKVKISLVTEGPNAERYVWTFGDGGPEVITTIPEVEHSYDILPGDDKTYRILVDGQGPENCQTSCGGEVEIPGICPVLDGLKLISSTLDKDTLEVEVMATIEGPMPTEFRWTWGDGTEELTATPTAKHTYQRLPGDKKIYFVELALVGPESCACESGMELEVPGICPEITALILRKDTPTATDTTVHAEAKIDGPAPTTYTWDWGDGNTEETATNKASHVYQRPVGDPVTYQVSVSIAGPESCACSEKGEVEIEEICPEITGSDISYLEQTRSIQKVKVSLTMEGPDAEAFTWDWGDGSSPEKTTLPEAEHEYKRPYGEDKTYTITVSSSGPCGCDSNIETKADIEGVCPSISDFDIKTIGDEEEYIEVEVNYSIEDPQPSSIEIDWGDGSAIETVSKYPATHSYQRKIGEDAEYLLTASFTGPGTCMFSCPYQIKVKGRCPKVQGIDAILVGSGEESQKVKASISLEGSLTAETYTWDWGDGSPIEETQLPEAEYSYPRAFGEDTSYTIQVGIKGPASCTCNAATPVIIPGRCPVLLHKKTIFGEWDPECQVVNIVYEVIGEAPESYTWDWGDGKTSTTKEPKASHTYDRSPEDKDYMVTLTTQGPGNCKIEQCIVIQVLGYCPRITSISTNYCGEGEAYQEVQFTVSYRGKEPDHFSWDFGDGSPLEYTQGNRHKHKFKQGKASALDYMVTVTAVTKVEVHNEEGCEEKECQDQGTVTVQIPGSCPAIIGMNSIVEDADANSQWIKWVVITRGPKPDSYEWNWGDGSSLEKTSEPFARHLFAKEEGVSKVYSIKVKAVGPVSKKGGIDCVTSYEVSLEIKGDEVQTNC